MDDFIDPDDRELAILEQRALTQWRELETFSDAASQGFAARVMAEQSRVELANAEAATPAPTLTAPRNPVVMAMAGAAAMAAAVGLWLNVRPSASSPDDVPTIAAVAGAPGTAMDEPSSAAPTPPDLARQIDNYVADYGRFFGPTFDFHGVILIGRRGQPLYAKAVGMADSWHDVPNEVDTRFRLGMLTEQFTAAAILMLRDAGALSLEDPVARFIPDFPNGTRITIKHLLEHTSGIPNYTDLPTFQRWKSLPHRPRELIGRFSHLPLQFDPGTDFRPTNSGYFLLGAIVEQASELPFGEYLRRAIFTPAGMHQSSFGDAYETGEQAHGHVWNAEEALDLPDPIDMSVFGGAGGVVSSAYDLLRWDQALYSGKVLPRASVAEMESGNRFGYGYGWLVETLYGREVLNFPGAIDGFNAAVMRFPEDQTLVVILCNTEVIPANRVAHDVAAMVYGMRPQTRIEYPEVQVAPGTLTRYLGAYRLSDDAVRRAASFPDRPQLNLLRHVSVRQVGDRLYFDVPGHGSSWMHPMGRHRFFFKDNTGDYISFSIDASGTASKLTVHYGDLDLDLDPIRP